MRGAYFILLLISSVIVLLQGYIINVLRPQQYRLINKLEKIGSRKIINRRWVYFSGTSYLALRISFRLLYGGKLILQVCKILHNNSFIVFFTPVSEEVVIEILFISALTAWVILVIAWCETSNLSTDITGALQKKQRGYLFLCWFHLFFLQRVVKDLEDIEGTTETLRMHHTYSVDAHLLPKF